MMRALTGIVGVLMLTATGAAGQVPAQTPDVLAEVRIHGNHTTPEADVLGLAGLVIGQPVEAATIAAAEQRLRRSGRFADVEIRKRARSLEPGGDVALIVIVREHALPDESIPGPPALRPLRRLMASGMFMPISRYTEGYGATYGARVTLMDALGRGSRVSVPLTWGGTRRAAVEFDRPMARGPFTRLFGGVAVSRRTNPFFETDEDRRDVWAEASRQFAGPFRVTARGGFGRVSFGPLVENVGTYGAEVSVDTRTDPVFPRNAVFASAGLERIEPSRGPGVNRVRLDVRGYRGLIRQSVVSLRVQYVGADAPLPLYERNLMGGAGTLRGYAAGSFSGDNLAAASAELRVPLTSPMGIGRAGLSVFTDAATVWNDGQRPGDARFRRGAGAGVFLMASLFQFSVDVGFRQGGGYHVHVTAGLQF